MTIRITAKEGRQKFAEMLNTAAFGRKNVIITRFNKPTAVLINYSQYEKLMDPRTRYTPEEWEEGFAVFDRVREKTQHLSQREIERLITTAVNEVRKQKGKTARRRRY